MSFSIFFRPLSKDEDDFEQKKSVSYESHLGPNESRDSGDLHVFAGHALAKQTKQALTSALIDPGKFHDEINR